MSNSPKTLQQFVRPKPFVLACLAALLVAVLLRFAWVDSQGFVEFDEGWLVDSATSMARHLNGQKREFYIDFKACPVTSFIFGLPIAVFGDSPQAIMYPTAFMGLLGVLLVSYLAYRMYGSTAALITLILGAVSPMQNLFSRTVALDTPGFFFLALSYLLIMLPSARDKLSKRTVLLFLGSGISLGLSLASNYRALSCIVLPSLVIIIREGIRFATAPKLLIHLAGFVGSLITLDVIMRLVYPISKGYFFVFSEQYKHIGGKTFGGGSGLLPSLHIKDSLNLILSLFDLDNPFTLALVALWILCLPLLIFRGRFRSEDLQLAAILLIPFGMFSILSVTAVRGLTVAQPFLALAAARFLLALSNSGIVGTKTLRTAVVASLVAIPTTFGLYKSIQEDVMGRENPFEVAFRETCAQYNTGVITILDVGPTYYARRLKCPSAIIHMGTGPLHLLKTYLQGNRFWLIDGQFSAYKGRLSALWPAFADQTPDLFIPAPSYIRLDHFVEHTVWSGTTYLDERTAYEEWINRWGARLPVFDLNNKIKALSWQEGQKDWYQVGSAIVSLPSRANAKDGFRITWDPSRLGYETRGRFNIHFNILPVEVGVALCDRGLSKSQCTGVGLLAHVKPAEVEFTLVDLSESAVKEITSVKIPPQTLGQGGPLWIRCVGNKVVAGSGDKEVLNAQSPRLCGESYPALFVREDVALEAFELSSAPSK
jgi:hypothetical protein